MFGKIKEYFTYRKNLKMIKRELTEVAANTLPLISTTTSNALDFVNFLTHVADECNKLSGKELISTIIREIADKLETDETRIYEILQYISTLSKEDMRKIVIHAQVETLPTKDI